MKKKPLPQDRGVIGWRGTLDLIVPYIRHRLWEQLRAIAFIIAYLIIFQIAVLKLPIAEVSTITGGIALVILGLAFFMEGIKIGLMPLGESLGLKLPRRSPMIGMLCFAFILGVGATFAEPAIGVLRTAGASVKAWDAPLLFFLLNTKADQLVYSIGIGVGLSVLLGILRFLYNWSLKPLLFILVPSVLILSASSLWDENLRHLLGLAWDSGAVTTGPVTVPLVLALGIGISRVIGGHTEEGTTSGFGVVTLASLTPIIAVLGLGFFYKPQVPNPMTELAFFAKPQQSQSLKVFQNQQQMLSYALRAASQDALQALHGGDFSQFAAWMKLVYQDPDIRSASLAPSKLNVTYLTGCLSRAIKTYS